MDIEKLWDEDELNGIVLGGYEPPQSYLVSEWADEFRVLSSKAASEPGRYRTARTPYLREVMDCLGISHPATEVVFKKASQVGATESAVNWLGYIIDVAPGPTLAVWPRDADVKRNVRLRVDPLINESPTLLEKVGRAKRADSSNTMFQKAFPGGELVLTGANSAAGLRSMPARNILLDEIDAYPGDLDGEGDPVNLAKARTRTFARKKIFIVSTPTVEGESKIDDRFEDSDQRHYYINCPHCDEAQVLDFEFLQWDDEKPETVLYYCVHCGEGIEEHYKTDMFKAGEWRAHNPGHEIIGFFLNALYSPLGWYSWVEIAKDYEEAKKELESKKVHDKMKVFWNTVLGKSYNIPGDAPPWRGIYDRRNSELEVRKVPLEAAFIVAGADVQKDRIELEVVAFSEDHDWSITVEIFDGDTARDEVWDDLKNFITKPLLSYDGKKEYFLQVCAIDSGYNTQKVYNFCRGFVGKKVIPVKGADEVPVMVGNPRFVDVKANGQTYRRGVRLYLVGSSVIKKEVYAKLKIEQNEDGSYPAGFSHFPEYDSEYFKQLTAEKSVEERNKRGYVTEHWVKTRARNEALDMRVYARAAANVFGMDRFKAADWDRVRGNVNKASIKDIDSKATSGRNRKDRPRRRTRRASGHWD